MPVAVTDRGELITWDVGGAVSSNKDGPVISTFSVFSISGADGKKRILFEEDRGVLNATLANGRVYYLSRLTNGRLAISWMKLR
jgi:hypothetical protein